MSGFQSPITIHNAIDRIKRNEFLLPAFQREFVWNSDQIEKLFDSSIVGTIVSFMMSLYDRNKHKVNQEILFKY